MNNCKLFAIFTTACLVTLPLACTTGCDATLSRKMATVTKEKANADKAFIAVMRTGFKAAGEMAAQKHQLQQHIIDTAWDDFVAAHTKDGRLVSIVGRTTTQPGVEMPMSVADLQKAIDARTRLEVQLADSKASWARVEGPIQDCIDKFIAASAGTVLTAENVAQAEESAAALFNTAITAIGGIAGGAVTGALIAP